MIGTPPPGTPGPGLSLDKLDRAGLYPSMLPEPAATTAGVVATLLVPAKPENPPRPTAACGAGKEWKLFTSLDSRYWACKKISPLPPVGHGVTAQAELINGVPSKGFGGGETLAAPSLKPGPTAAPAGTVPAPMLPPVKVKVGPFTVSVPASIYG